MMTQPVYERINQYPYQPPGIGELTVDFLRVVGRADTVFAQIFNSAGQCIETVPSERITLESPNFPPSDLRRYVHRRPSTSIAFSSLNCTKQDIVMYTLAARRVGVSNPDLTGTHLEIGTLN